MGALDVWRRACERRKAGRNGSETGRKPAFLRRSLSARGVLHGVQPASLVSYPGAQALCPVTRLSRPDPQLTVSPAAKTAICVPRRRSPHRHLPTSTLPNTRLLALSQRTITPQLHLTLSVATWLATPLRHCENAASLRSQLAVCSLAHPNNVNVNSCRAFWSPQLTGHKCCCQETTEAEGRGRHSVLRARLAGRAPQA